MSAERMIPPALRDALARRYRGRPEDLALAVACADAWERLKAMARG